MTALSAAKTAVYVLGRCAVSLLACVTMHEAMRLQPSPMSTASALAFTCFANLLLFVMHMLYFACTIAYQALTDPRRPSHNVLVLEAEGDVFALRFQELVARCHAESTLVYQRPKPATLTTTVPLLWYHIYAMGFAFFTLSYSVHSGALPATLIMLLTTLACAFHHLLANPHPDGLSRLLLFLLTTGALCLLMARLPTIAGDNWLVCIVLPAACPLMLYNLQRGQSLQLTASQLFVFAMPCVAMMSICYLSAYLPIHSCTSLSGTSLSNLLLASGGNGTVTLADALASMPSIVQSHPTVVLSTVMTPFVLCASVLMYADALQRPQRILGVCGCFVLVQAAKHCYEDPGSKQLQASVAMVSTAAFLSLWLDPVPLKPKETKVDTRLQEEEEAS